MTPAEALEHAARQLASLTPADRREQGKRNVKNGRARRKGLADPYPRLVSAELLESARRDVNEAIRSHRGEDWAERAVAALDAEYAAALKDQLRREARAPEWARVSTPDDLPPSSMLGGASLLDPLANVQRACEAARMSEEARRASILAARQTGLTLAAIASAAGVTAERVRQLTTA